MKNLFSILIASTLIFIGSGAFAKVDPAQMTDAKEMTVVAKSQVFAANAPIAPFIKSSIPEVRKYLVDQKAKLTSAITYVIDNPNGSRTVNAGYIIAAPVKISGEFKMVKVPAGKALTTYVRGPLTEIPDGYRALVAKYKATPNLKDRGHSYEIYLTDANAPAAKQITQISALVEQTKK